MRARRYMRTHQSRIDMVRQKPAISHQPPSFSGGNDRPYFGDGGSSARKGSSLMKRMRFQSTEAHMLRPITSMATKPKAMDNSPSQPRTIGPSWSSPILPSSFECPTSGALRPLGWEASNPYSTGPLTSITS